MTKESYSDSYLKQCAREAIYKLRMHINYLAESFGLDAGELWAMPTQHIVQTQGHINKLDSQPKEQLPTPSNEKPDLMLVPPAEAQVEYTAQDFIHHQDDDAFQEMFS